MSELRPVSFKQGRARLPRLSKPYVPGKRSSRFWSAADDAVMKEWYPKGGLAAAAAHLPAQHTSRSSIYQRANFLGLHVTGKPSRRGGRIQVPENIDDILRREYELQDGKKRGAINAVADKLELPRWWVTKRAIKLGLTMPHKKEPPWTAAEIALLAKVPLHDTDRCSRIFKEHGFQRSAMSIRVKAQRQHLSRRYRETMTARAAAKIVGFDDKTMTTYCIDGHCKATRRESDRLPQQGGAPWSISRADLRQFVIDHLERIDFRKVDKFALVDLLVSGLDTQSTASGERPANQKDVAMRNKFNLDAMTIEQLLDIRQEITAALEAKGDELRAQLELLEDTAPAKRRASKTRAHAAKGRKIAPKFVGPNGETWAGCGARPRWLKALVDDGHQADEFRLAA